MDDEIETAPIFRDERLSLEAIGLWAFTVMAPAEHQYRQELIRLRFRMSKDEFSRAWGELVRCGYITITPDGKHSLSETAIACPMH